jgi:hypothetical protein
MREVRDEALADRISDVHEYDWYGLGFLPHRRRSWRASNQEHVWRQAD